MTQHPPPREWLAAITTPTRGVMDMAPGAWNHCPATTERVRVREVLVDEPSGIVVTAAAGSSDAAAAVTTAMTELARELGCAYSDLIQHNAGLFIPGEAQACADPVDAIRRLFAHVRAGGRVNRPEPLLAGEPAPRAGQAITSPATDPRQVALFSE